MSVESGERLKEENSQKIIRAVQKMLNEENYTDISMVQIANKAGVVKKTIHNIFGTKKNLVVLTAIDAYENLHLELEKIVTSEQFMELSGLDQVLKLHVERAKYGVNHPYIMRLLSDIERMKLTEKNEIENCMRFVEIADSIKDYYDEPLKKGMEDGSIKTNLDVDAVRTILFFSFGAIAQKLHIISLNEIMKNEIDTYGMMRVILKETRLMLSK